MIWFVVWAVLVVVAALVIGRLGWTVFRKGTAVAAEAGKAAERASGFATQVERIGQRRGEAELAVFVDPRGLRRTRHGRRRGRAGHRVQSSRRASRA